MDSATKERPRSLKPNKIYVRDPQKAAEDDELYYTIHTHDEHIEDLVTDDDRYRARGRGGYRGWLDADYAELDNVLHLPYREEL